MSLMSQVGIEFVARNRAAGVMGQFERSINSFARSALSAFGVGSGLYMAKNLLQSSVREFANYERQLARVSTVLNAASMDYLPRYDQAIRKMATTYGEAAESLTSGTYEILSAQIDAADSMKMLETVVRSAKGGFTTADVTMSATVQILKAYNLQVAETARVQDILHATVQQARFSFEDFASNIGDVIGLAAYLDVKLEAVGASLSVMNKAGLSANVAVTALKNILSQFLNPSAEAIKAAGELGFALDETSVQGEGLIRIIDGLKNASASQLEALMPNLRGTVGFASQLKNAASVANDYRVILNGVGLAETNFQKAMATTATELAKTREHWIELKRTIGEEVAPVLNAVLPVLNRMVDALSDAVPAQKQVAEGMSNLSFAMTEAILKTGQGGRVFSAQWELARRQYEREMGKWQQVGPGGKFRVPADRERFEQLLKHFQSGALTNLPLGKLEVPADRLKVMEDMARRAAELEKNIGRVTDISKTGRVRELSEEEKRGIIERAKETMESVRHQDYLTRMERIESLRIYAKENAGTLAQVAEANRLLDEEIRSIERSRVDAMKVYRAELREDMQNLNLYLSERFAEASRSMESALSNSFQSMIRDGASWRDATIQFLTEVRNAFIKMAADMVARQASAGIIEPIMSGLLGTLTGGGGGPGNQVVSPNYSPNYSMEYSNAGVPAVIKHNEGRVGDVTQRRWVDSSIFENAPRFHDLRPGETAIIAQNDEVISRPGRSRAGQPPSIVINNNTGQKFESQGPSFDGERWVIGIVAQNIKQGGGLKKMMGR